MIRKTLSIILSLVILVTFSSCKSGSINDKIKVSIWVLSEEYKQHIQWACKNYCNDTNWVPDITVVDSSSLLNIEETVTNLPDVIMLSPEMIEPMANSKYIMPLSEAGIYPNEEKYYKYAFDTGKVNCKLYAMCFHTSPGLFAYRRSLSKAYLGTDTPENLSLILDDWDSFLDVAQLVKVSSNEETFIVAGIADITRSYFSGDFSKLSEQKVEEYFELSKKLYDGEFVYGAEQWSEAWVRGFNDSKSVFSYFLSGIAVDDVLSEVSNESYGDWSVAAPFSPYSWGGAYLAVGSQSDKKNEAAELIEILTVNEVSVKGLSLYSGIFTANKEVNLSVSNDNKFELSVLGGQNYYKVLIESAEKIENTALSKSSDAAIISLLNSCADNYSKGKYDLPTAVSTFFSLLSSLGK